MAWHAVGPRASRLWVVLLKFGDRWVRVHIEELSCVECRGRVLAANPNLWDLYAGVSDKVAALAGAGSLPVVSCPNCGTLLERGPVWAEMAG